MPAPLKFWASLLVALAGLVIGLHYLTDQSRPAGPAASALALEEADAAPERAATAEPPLEPADILQERQEAAQPEMPWFPPSPKEPPMLAESSIRDSGKITVKEAAARVTIDRPVLVIFFSTTCPRSRAAFPSFVNLAHSAVGRYNVLAYATDDNASDVSDFLLQNGATFSAEILASWQAGEFSRAMGAIGLHVGSTWVKPLIAVIDSDGRVLGQWQGLTDLRPIQPVLTANTW